MDRIIAKVNGSENAWMDPDSWDNIANAALLFIYFLDLGPESFCPKKFFQVCGLAMKSPQDVKKVFSILDNDGSGYIEEEELKWVPRDIKAFNISGLYMFLLAVCRFFLQRFCPTARVLTEKETKNFLSTADEDNDGRIGLEGTSAAQLGEETRDGIFCDKISNLEFGCYVANVHFTSN